MPPVKPKTDGMLMHMAGEVYQVLCEQITFAVNRDLLTYAGLRLPQHFCGTGYSDGVCLMPGFSARIWLIETN